MPSCEQSRILRVIEVIDPNARFSDVYRRAAQFLENGVAEYWMVYEEAKEIHPVRLGSHRSPDGGKLPPDFDEQVAQFFR